MRIFLGEEDIGPGNAPVDTQGGVVPGDGSLRRRVIVAVALVLEHRLFAQDGEPVRKTARDEQLPMVLSAEFTGHIPAKPGRAHADIDRNIQHPAAHHANQFSLDAASLLEVQAPHHAVSALALIILDKFHVTSQRGIQVPLAPALEEVAACVSKHSRFYEKDTGDRSFFNRNHICKDTKKKRIFAPMKQTPVRIALVSHGFPLGGVSRVNLSIAERIAAITAEFQFVIFSDSAVPEGRFPIPVYPVRDYLKAVRELDIDILVECSRLERGTAAIREAGVKVVYADHGQAFGEQFAILDRRRGSFLSVKRALWYLFQKWRYDGTGRAFRMAVERTARAYENSDAYVSLCPAYKEEIVQELQLPEDNRISVIRNYQSPVENPCLEKEKRILFCGRLSRYDKRADRLLRIWKKVQDQLPDYSLDIVGDGRQHGRLVRMARRLKLKRVTFWGKRFDTDNFYKEASILCLTSQTEGWPLVLTEAQAHGVIPIAFDCSAGIHEILDGGAGVLVPLANEDAFARELVRLGQSGDLRPLRERCIEKSRFYSQEKNTEGWLSLFRQLATAISE